MSEPKWTFERVEGHLYGIRTRFVRVDAGWWWFVEPDDAPSAGRLVKSRATAWRQAVAAAERMSRPLPKRGRR